MLGLYLHVPFCQAICSYCNFNRGLLDADLKTRYVRALAEEIRRAADGRAADTIFFGGGTPSLLEPSEVAELIDACATAFDLAPDAEVTLETNPETVTRERMLGFRAAGINRVSMGVQSFDDAELQRLGRIHSARRAVAAFEAARSAGVDNLSLDLMCWLPGQSRASWRESVSKTIGLEPDHVSLYLLELYPNAPLKEAMAREAARPAAPGSAWQQAADDDAAEMYLEGLQLLDEAGLAQYEISNVARPGRMSRHNLKYWTAGEWRGFGCGAHSTLGGRRWKNVASTTDYVDRIGRGDEVIADLTTLSDGARLEEALFTGLRLSAGIERQAFVSAHGVDPWARYGENLASFMDEGLMWTTGTRFGLTREGMLVSNEILAVFV
jgi:oxygen-independent coproporphyrinogen-3 oxidase